ncbi:hypothetical protein NA56DRAFT_655243 [Hyaloscypha hepaticicola]|uniref:Uncharacterized protein n=1 Tax=Hyaloscypha hepaticicola TaxID=2082293 RepID=A0A2J6QHS8_9HELO|nr:hypothetical protein NA56DRAFT_655243 [Hyaloscypha hepaticicola]
MRTSLTLLASAMLATARFVLAGEDAWITAVEELTTYWVPPRHPDHSTCTNKHHSYHPKHTPPASYYPTGQTPSYYPHHKGTGSYYPWHPATTVTVFITVYPETCAPTPPAPTGGYATATVVPLPSNSTGNSSTPTYVPSNGTTYGTNVTNGTSPESSSGAAPMGISFNAGIVGAFGVLFAFL